MEKETRCFPTSLNIEKRADGKFKISGYAAVFDRDSEDLGGFVERIAPGAFTRALQNSDVRALFNHNQDHILGRTSAGTLRLREDKTGLFMEIDPPDTQMARDLMESIKRGDIREQSFAFTVGKDEWENIDDRSKGTIRTIREINKLYDVSPVTYPAYPDTSVAIRSMREQCGLPEIDRIIEKIDDENGVPDDVIADLDRIIGKLK